MLDRNQGSGISITIYFILFLFFLLFTCCLINGPVNTITAFSLVKTVIVQCQDFHSDWPRGQLETKWKPAGRTDAFLTRMLLSHVNVIHEEKECKTSVKTSSLTLLQFAHVWIRVVYYVMRKYVFSNLIASCLVFLRFIIIIIFLINW